jgi:hypothetical protein
MVKSKTKIIKRQLTQPSFKLRYASDCTLSFSLFSPLSPLGLKNILVQHESLKFMCFHAGIITDKSRFRFHDRITLPNLKKITVVFPSQEDEEKEKSTSSQSQQTDDRPISGDFKRLLHILKQIHYGQLDTIRIDTNSTTATRIPLASAFVPTYELDDEHPLSDLILKNRESLQNLVIGPILKEMSIKLNPPSCPVTESIMCEPKNYPKMETIISFPDTPLLPSWSVMLRPQRHLTQFWVTLSHNEVWRDVCEAIKKSCDSITSFGFSLLPMDGEAEVVDLKVLQVCRNLKGKSKYLLYKEVL